MSLQRQVVEELRDVMQRQGIRQCDLARRIGMKDAQLSIIFSCQRPNGVTLKTLERIADGLDVGVELHLVEMPTEGEAAA